MGTPKQGGTANPIVTYLLLIGGSICAYTAFAFYGYYNGHIFNSSNLLLSAIAATVFYIGSLAGIFALVRLRREDRLIRSLMPRALRSQEELESLVSSLPEASNTRRQIVLLVQSAKSNMGLGRQELLSQSDSVTTSIIEFIYYTASAALLVGLLGTLLGIIEAVAGYRETLLSSPNILEQLRAMLSGLDKAFGTTSLGIAGALILNFTALLCSQSEASKQSNFNVLSGNIIPVLGSYPVDLVASIVERSIMRTLPSTIREVSEQLTLATGRLEGVTQQAASYADSLRENAETVSLQLSELRRHESQLMTTISSLSKQNSETIANNAQFISIIGSVDKSLKIIGETSADFNSNLGRQSSSIASLSKSTDLLSHSVSPLSNLMRQLQLDIKSYQEAIVTREAATNKLAERVAALSEQVSGLITKENKRDGGAEERSQALVDLIVRENRRTQRSIDELMRDLRMAFGQIASRQESPLTFDNSVRTTPPPAEAHGYAAPKRRGLMAFIQGILGKDRL